MHQERRIVVSLWRNPQICHTSPCSRSPRHAQNDASWHEHPDFVQWYVSSSQKYSSFWIKCQLNMRLGPVMSSVKPVEWIRKKYSMFQRLLWWCCCGAVPIAAKCFQRRVDVLEYWIIIYYKLHTIKNSDENTWEILKTGENSHRLRSQRCFHSKQKAPYSV